MVNKNPIENTQVFVIKFLNQHMKCKQENKIVSTLLNVETVNIIKMKKHEMKTEMKGFPLK